MSARLFRRIKTIFVRLNKTFVLVTAILIVGVFIHTTPTFAITEVDLKAQYTNWINLFDVSPDPLTQLPSSGITKIGVLTGTEDNKALGLALTLSLTLKPAVGEKLEDAWNRIESYKSDIFVSKLCLDSDPTKCWISGLPWTISGTDSRQIIAVKDAKGEYTSKEIATVNAFNNVQSSNNTENSDLYTYNPKDNSTTLVPSIGLPRGQAMTASLWYCANGDGASAFDAYATNKITTTNPAHFGNLCNGNENSYFQIGAPVSITIAADDAGLQQQIQAGQQAVAQKAVTSSTEDDNLPECGIIGSGTINGCAAQLAYGIYNLAAWIAALFGKLFDFFIGYSVSDTSYRYTFAVTGWKLVRDISNIFFIIILVWTGFSAVFDISKNSMKQVLPNLIINAILINFSLFATRVVIDVSNITARMFYSEMVVCDAANINPGTNTCDPAQAKRGLGGYWPLSEKIVSSFNPQKIFTPSVLKDPAANAVPNVADNKGASFSATNAGNISDDVTSRDYANYFGIVCLIAAGIMIAIAIMFFKVSFLFLGRVVGLYVCMIFSPFAFLSREIPLLGKIEKLRWSDWFSELTSYAMLAPVFIFFLYIIYTILSSDFVGQIGVGDKTGSFFGIVMEVVIPMVIVYTFMGQAQKAAERLSGDIGKSIQSFGTSVTGLAVGAASGGAALMGGRVLGGLAKRVDESRVGVGVRNLAAKSGVAGFAGRSLQRGLNATRSGSFDVRQSAVGKNLFSKLGLDTNQKSLNALAGVGLGLGTDQRKGGFDADVKRRQEKDLENEKLLEEKDGAGIAAYNERQKKSYNKKVTAALEAEMINVSSAADVAAAKAARDNKTNPQPQEYERIKKEALAQQATQDAVNAIAPAKQVASADELARTRRKTYSEGLKQGGLFTQAKDWAVKRADEKGGFFNNALGATAEILSATTGAALGSQVRTEGSRKAAKKVEERSKADKELQDIEETLKKGFQDLITLEKFKNSPSFTALQDQERSELLATGAIQTGPQAGKRMYDILTDQEKATVNAEESVINSDKTSKERFEKRVQAVEQSRYNMNDLKKESKKQKTKMVDPAATQTERDVAENKYWETQTEIEQAVKHGKIWSDISRYQEEQKKKAKGEETK